MKRISTTLAIIALCGSLMAPQIEARGSRNGNSPKQSTHQSVGRGQRPQQGSRPGNNNPGNRPSNPGSNHGNNPGNRPSNPGNNSSNSNNPGNRPSNPGNQGNNPGNNPGNRPSNQGHRPDNRPQVQRPSTVNPGFVNRHPAHHPVPVRPWKAPVPPRGWRPGPTVPVFSTVLGITFGTALNISLNALIHNGYTVSSYGNNVVYLNNVNQLNLLWPDATLYYSGGGLSRGEFIYFTDYYDTMRYNNAYSRLVAAYGNPVSTTYPSNGMQTTWFGPDGRYVTLSYQPGYGGDGYMRYYTTLTFGY